MLLKARAWFLIGFFSEPFSLLTGILLVHWLLPPVWLKIFRTMTKAFRLQKPVIVQAGAGR